jgi:hypothetical protein
MLDRHVLHRREWLESKPANPMFQGHAFQILHDDDSYLSELVCGIAYDSRYPHFGHRSVVTETNRLESILRPVQKLDLGFPGDQFCCR